RGPTGTVRPRLHGTRGPLHRGYWTKRLWQIYLGKIVVPRISNPARYGALSRHPAAKTTPQTLSSTHRPAATTPGGTRDGYPGRIECSQPLHLSLFITSVVGR